MIRRSAVLAGALLTCAFQALPQTGISIYNLNPSSAPAGSPDTPLTITGSFMAGEGNPNVYWFTSTVEAVLLPVSSFTGSQIFATIPSSLLTHPDTATIYAVQGSAVSNQLQFIITPAASITSLNPSSTAAGSPTFTLTVNGTNIPQFSPAGAPTSVVWNGGTLASTWVSSQQITAQVPASLVATPGSARVTLNTQPAPTALTFTITATPATLTSLSPNSTAAGSPQFTLTLNGTGFQQGAFALWNATQLSTTFVNATQLTATVPANLVAQAGTAQVSVNTGGQVTANLPFTINPPAAPTLSSISPNTAQAGGGQFTLTANGANFANGAVITWNGTSLATTFVSATQLTTTVPASLIVQPGTAQVGVTSNSQSTATLPFTITSPPPTLTSISPNTTQAGSAQFILTANGTGFVNGAVVTWNGSALATQFVNANELTATVPASLVTTAGTAQVGVISNQQATGTLPFTITSPTLMLTSISPSTTVAGSPQFTLTANGTGFNSGSVIQWNGSGLQTTFVNGNQLTATVPANLVASQGTAQVSVNSAGVTTQSLPFTITAANPTLTSISPNTAVAGSPQITITANGTGFTPNSAITWAGTAGLQTTFVNANQLAAIVPATLLLASGTVQVGVTTAGVSTPTLPFTITSQLLTLTSISPNTTVAGSPQFTLTASGAGFSSTAVVIWNSTPLATSFVNANQLTATVPATLVATAGTAQVSVSSNGQTTSTLPFTITAPTLTLTSISPNTAVSGGPQFTLTANGTGFTSGAVVTWNGSVLATSIGSATQLTATVPASLIANPGIAQVGVTSAGQSTSTLGFTITNGFTLTNISPSSALAGGPGFTLTATGSGFTSGTFLTWNGAALSTTFVNSNTLTASVPAGLLQAQGTATVSAVNGSQSTNGLNFSITGIPVTITSVTPNSAPAGSPPLTITVTGSGFLPPAGTAVTFNGNVLTTTVVSSTQLTAVVPVTLLMTPGTATVGVTGGSTPSFLPFVITSGLMLTSVSPSTVGAGGPAFTLTATGTGFTPSTTVIWNGIPLTTTYVSPTQLTAQVPGGLIATAGVAQVGVNAPGQITPPTLPVNITQSITLTSLSPNSATTGGAGLTLIANGTGFTSGTTLSWNGIALATTFGSSTQLSAQIPANLLSLPGNASIIASAGGIVSNALTFVVLPPTPTITSLAPSTANVGGPALTMTITGTGYLPSSTVTWNGLTLGASFVSPTQINAQVTADLLSKVGTAQVVVSNGELNSNAAAFTVVPVPPMITSVSPNPVVAGDPAFTLTVNGTGFLSGATVSWNGTQLNTTFGSATQLTAQVSAALIATAGTASVSVGNPNGGTSNTVSVTIAVPTPTITSLAPASVVAGSPAFTLTINGTRFLTGATASLNGTALSTNFGSATQVTAQVPANLVAQVGTATVTVANPNGAASNGATLTITGPVPTITSISPSTATQGGPAFTLTVNGTNFVSGSTVTLGSNALTTTFGSTTQLTAQVPASLLTQPGNVPVTVSNPGGAVSAPVPLIINPPVPTITSLSPNTAAAGGPEFTLTINGTNFLDGATASFNTTQLSTTVVSSTQITARVPANLLAQAGPATVVVANRNGQASAPASFNITPSGPTITRIDPVSARVGDATFTLSVTGTGFVPASIVQWDGAPLSTTFVSPTQLTATIAAGRLILPATAQVTVVNPGGVTSNAVPFTINPVTPSITSIAPNSAIAGDAAFTLTVNGTGMLTLTVIQWNSTQLTTHYVSATQVMADVPANLIANAGNVQVTAVNPGNNVSNAITFTINPATPAVLTSLSRNTATAGDAAFTVTVNGTGLRNGAVVNFGRWDPLESTCRHASLSIL